MDAGEYPLLCLIIFAAKDRPAQLTRIGLCPLPSVPLLSVSFATAPLQKLLRFCLSLIMRVSLAGVLAAVRQWTSVCPRNLELLILPQVALWQTHLGVLMGNLLASCSFTLTDFCVCWRHTPSMTSKTVPLICLPQ